ncbi:hypothetical protein [Nodosilinea sp. PGN35]|uniref:hypothetical protein n=1 Tax=Nodosilinea sp. PGN35 TaxID=3020489 RepID=UPI00398B28F4
MEPSKLPGARFANEKETVRLRHETARMREEELRLDAKLREEELRLREEELRLDAKLREHDAKLDAIDRKYATEKPSSNTNSTPANLSAES